jgi:hypothetical protein
MPGARRSRAGEVMTACAARQRHSGYSRATVFQSTPHRPVLEVITERRPGSRRRLPNGDGHARPQELRTRRPRDPAWLRLSLRPTGLVSGLRTVAAD